MSQAPKERRSIYVFAGTNGAGKSSVAGAAFRARGWNYFNPDEAARRIQAERGEELQRANSLAWLHGKRLLENAISAKADFAFETTLGGNTIPALLERAHDAGLAVHVWFVGLASADLHIARVQARVAAGGHPIPPEKIRERYDRSRENLIRLLPRLTELRLFDNSREGNLKSGLAPRPQLILSMLDGRIEETCEVADVPDWAKPIFVAAFRTYGI